jgi:hypothetical protein
MPYHHSFCRDDDLHPHQIPYTVTTILSAAQSYLYQAHQKYTLKCRFRHKMTQCSNLLSMHIVSDTLMYFSKGIHMSEPTKTLSDLMDELSVALSDLSDKMGSLTHVLENNYLQADKLNKANASQPYRKQPSDN